MIIDPTHALRADHRMVEQLIDEIDQADPSVRKPLIRQLAKALRAHMKIEEDLLYPVVAEVLGKAEATEANTEHVLAREGLDKVMELGPGAPGFGAALDMLRTGIHHHVQDEEGEMFPQLLDRLDQPRLARLGEEMDRARGKLGLPTEVELLKESSREELYEQAKRAGVPGRSSMSKEELAEALVTGS
jgi:uncharacterized protein (UPF0216 family)